MDAVIIVQCCVRAVHGGIGVDRIVNSKKCKCHQDEDLHL